MTPELAEDLFLLQSELGISAAEALHGRPEWEIDLLLGGLKARMTEPQAPVGGGEGSLTMTGEEVD